MATFFYKALDGEKQLLVGSLAAASREEAAQFLAKKGLSPVTVKEGTETVQVHGRIPLVEKITFCRHLSVMISSGLSLSEGVEVLHAETKHPLMKRILSDIAYGLEQGLQLSTIFERYPEVFESYFLTLTRAGEVSGNLGAVFKYLEQELRSEYQLNSKVKGALMYPAIVFVAMIGIGILMLFFVLPQLAKVFLNLNLPLPLYTKIIFQTSLVISGQAIPVAGGAVLGLILIVIGIRQKWIQEILIRLIQPIPFILHLVQKIDLARFSRIFSTLIRSAVPITEALEISLTSLTWYRYRRLARILPDEIRKGKSFATTVREQKIFPSLMVQMVTAGEKTASLDSALADLATFYEQEVEEELHNLTQILEPLLMLLVGVGVGVMILSIIAPIYSIVGNFQSAAGGGK